ncbi:relaxase/mobilization nuclease domain-containing protein [Vibrio splendidus]
MLVKLFTPATENGALGGLNYLLDENRNDAPELLSGNPEVTRQLLLSSVFKNPYTTGCLSFAEEESDISKELQDELMQSFEETLMTGLDPNQYDIIWIKHTDKNRLELNFHILNTELQTGKRLQPYLHQFDKSRIEAWKSLQNDLHGLADPNAPERKRTLQPGALKQDWQSVKNAVHNYLEDAWVNNEINSRSELLDEISKLGGEIKRQGKDYISIKFPDTKKNIRFKGELYNENLRPCEEFTGQKEQQQARYNQEREQRIEANRAKLDLLNKKRGKHRKEKYRYIIEKTEEAEKILAYIDSHLVDAMPKPRQRIDDISAHIDHIREQISSLPRVQGNERQAGFLQDPKKLELENGLENERDRTFNTKLRAIAIAVRSAVQRIKSAFNQDGAERQLERDERQRVVREQIRHTRQRQISKQRHNHDLGRSHERAPERNVQNVRVRQGRSGYESEISL